MVKFSSLLEYRNYIDNLPLDFIVMELIRIKTASKTSLLRPAPLLGRDAINYSLEDLVGKITFKLLIKWTFQLFMKEKSRKVGSPPQY